MVVHAVFVPRHGEAIGGGGGGRHRNARRPSVRVSVTRGVTSRASTR